MKLFGYRNGRTLRAAWALEEVKAEYEYIEVDVLRGEGRAPWFLEINPGGKVPVLVDGQVIVPESAAICLHLADRHPSSGLMPSSGSAARTDCYRWISFILTELDAPLWNMAKHRFALPVEHRVPQAVETARWEFMQALPLLAKALDDRLYLVGDQRTVPDLLAAHILSWATASRVPIPNQNLALYMKRLMGCEAAQRAQSRLAGPRSLGDAR